MCHPCLTSDIPCTSLVLSQKAFNLCASVPDILVQWCIIKVITDFFYKIVEFWFWATSGKIGWKREHAINYNWYQFSLSLTCSLSSTAEKVESVVGDLKREYGEQHVWVPTAAAQFLFLSLKILSMHVFLLFGCVTCMHILLPSAELLPFFVVIGNCLWC